MSLPDPLPVATDPAATFARVWSPVQNQSVFRKEYPTAAMTITVTQALTKTRKRHLVRMEVQPVPASGVTVLPPSTSFNFTIDEPIVAGLSDTDMTYFCNVLKGTMTDALVARLLNGEL